MQLQCKNENLPLKASANEIAERDGSTTKEEKLAAR
jgi:hypothetical protein